MSLTDLGFDRFFSRAVKKEGTTVSAADYDSYFEDGGIDPSKLESSQDDSQRSKGLKYKTSAGAKVDLIKIDEADYCVLGDIGLKGIKPYQKVKFRVSRSTNQFLKAQGTAETKIILNDIETDEVGCYNTATNNFSVPVSGYYLVSLSMRTDTIGAGNRRIYLYNRTSKDGVTNNDILLYASERYSNPVTVSDMIYLSTDKNCSFEAYNELASNMNITAASLSVILLSV